MIRIDEQICPESRVAPNNPGKGNIMTYENMIDNALQAGNNGEWAYAITISKSAITKEPGRGKAHHYLIAAYLRCNDWKSALEAGQQADKEVADTDPWKARILFAWADAEIMEENFNKAKNILTRIFTYFGSDSQLDRQGIKYRHKLLSNQQSAQLRAELFRIKGLPMPAPLQKHKSNKRLLIFAYFVTGFIQLVGIPWLMYVIYRIGRGYGSLTGSPEGKLYFGLCILAGGIILVAHNTTAFKYFRKLRGQNRPMYKAGVWAGIASIIAGFIISII